VIDLFINSLCQDGRLPKVNISSPGNQYLLDVGGEKSSIQFIEDDSVETTRKVGFDSTLTVETVPVPKKTCIVDGSNPVSFEQALIWVRADLLRTLDHSPQNPHPAYLDEQAKLKQQPPKRKLPLYERLNTWALAACNIITRYFNALLVASVFALIAGLMLLSPLFIFISLSFLGLCTFSIVLGLGCEWIDHKAVVSRRRKRGLRGWWREDSQGMIFVADANQHYTPLQLDLIRDGVLTPSGLRRHFSVNTHRSVYDAAHDRRGAHIHIGSGLAKGILCDEGHDSPRQQNATGALAI
jgi:hypothetical protein